MTIMSLRTGAHTWQMKNLTWLFRHCFVLIWAVKAVGFMGL